VTAPTQAPAGAAGSDLKNVARGGSIATVGAIVASAGGLLLTVVVGRGLGADGAGLFFEAVAVFSIASSVAMFGADTTLLRNLSRARALGRYRDLRPILLVALVPVIAGTAVITGLLLLFLPSLVDLVAHTDTSLEAERYFSVLLPFLLVGTLATVLVQATRSFGGVLPFVLVQNVLLPLGRPLAVVVVVVAGWSALAIPLTWAGLLVPALMVAAVTLVRQVRRVERRIDATTPPGRSPWDIGIEFWTFSAVRGLASAIDLSLVWFDVLLVGAIRSTAEAGVYATASRFVVSGTLVMQAMRLAIAPQISALLSTGQRERAGEIYRVATLWIVVTSWPLYLALAFFGPLALELFGHDFTSAGSALSILSIAMLLNLGTGNVGTVLLMAGKSRWLLIDKAAAVTVNIGLNLLLVPDHGIDGAAIAWGAAIAVDNLAAVAQVRYGLGLRGYSVSTVLFAGAALVAYGAGGLLVQALLGDGYPALVTYLVTGTIVYGGSLWIWRDKLHLPDLLAALGRRRARALDRPTEPEPRKVM
jgi:O-antigen/teichoic acid export membrane protein